MAAAAGVLVSLLMSFCPMSSYTRLHLRDGVGTTSHGLLARLAAPDANSSAADAVLAAESASVPGVLGHFLLYGSVNTAPVIPR
jgi:hypothetical protein